MDDLDYEEHLENYKQLFGYYSENSNKEQVLKSAEQKAQNLHMISVFNPLRDWVPKANLIAQKIKNGNARYYSGRTKPLSYEEQMEITQDINVIYINLRGVLDNFAWCFLYERHPELESKINPNKIGLFSKGFREKCSAFADIESSITVHDE